MHDMLLSNRRIICRKQVRLLGYYQSNGFGLHSDISHNLLSHAFIACVKLIRLTDSGLLMMYKYFRRLTLLLLVPFFLTEPALSESARNSSAWSEGPLISTKVAQSLAFDSKVRVLVKLRNPSDSPHLVRTATALEVSRFISKGEIKRLQRMLESSFTAAELKSDMEIVRRLDNVPWMSGKITGKALEKLKRHPNVAMIVEDEPVEAFLAESAPLIGSDIVNGSGQTGIGVSVAVLDTGISGSHIRLSDDLIWEECFLLYGGCPVTGTTRASGPAGVRCHRHWRRHLRGDPDADGRLPGASCAVVRAG